MSGSTLAPVLVGGVGVLVGLLLWAIGSARGRMQRGWVSTEATVVTREGSTSGPTARTPTFRWTDADGREHQRTSMVKQGLGPRPGSTVPVRYDPDNPDRGVLDTGLQNGRVLRVVGVVVIVVALVAAFLVGSLVDAMSNLT